VTADTQVITGCGDTAPELDDRRWQMTREPTRTLIIMALFALGVLVVTACGGNGGGY